MGDEGIEPSPGSGRVHGILERVRPGEWGSDVEAGAKTVQVEYGGPTIIFRWGYRRFASHGQNHYLVLTGDRVVRTAPRQLPILGLAIWTPRFLVPAICLALNRVTVSHTRALSSAGKEWSSLR